MPECDRAAEMLTAFERRPHSKRLLSSFIAHIRACETCQEMLRDLDQPHLSSFVVAPERSKDLISKETYSQVLDKAFRRIVDENEELERQRGTVPGLVAELSGLSLNRQKLLVRNSGRYQVWALAEALLVESRLGWTEDPNRSEDLAQLALEVADSLSVAGFRVRILNDLRAEAWSYIANCRRIKSDYHEAGSAFNMARRFLAEGSGDRLEQARVSDLEASLLADRGDYLGADRLLTEAIDEYRAAKDRHLEGRVLVKRAKQLHDRGLVHDTIPVLERAASLIDITREPRLLFILKRNLMSHLIEAGRAPEAQALLPEVRELAREHASRLGRLRLLWTEGLLCKALGQTELAVEVLKQVREGFVGVEIGQDVALVSLDLATIYLEADRTAEVRQLAAESVPLFASRGVHREVIMAWSLFREAADKDLATLAVVRDVVSRIRRSPAHQSSSFEAP